MDRRPGSGPVVVVAAVVVGGVIVYFGVLGWLSAGETSRAPIDLGDRDAAAHVVVESGDRFNVGLLGHPSDDQAAWIITEIDGTVVDALAVRHEPRSSALPDADYFAETPDRVRELWSTVPSPDRPPDEVDPDGEVWLYPMTHFEFAGGNSGESVVQLELRVGGESIHSFAFTVTVVDGDACDFFEGEGASTKLPNRCR